MVSQTQAVLEHLRHRHYSHSLPSQGLSNSPAASRSPPSLTRARHFSLGADGAAAISGNCPSVLNFSFGVVAAFSAACVSPTSGGAESSRNLADRRWRSYLARQKPIGNSAQRAPDQGTREEQHRSRHPNAACSVDIGEGRGRFMFGASSSANWHRAGAEKINTARRLARGIATDPYGVMGRAPATKHDNDILAARPGDTVGKRRVGTAHGGPRRGSGWCHPNIRASRRPCPERLLDSFDDAVEQSRLRRRINHGEAVDETTIAAEDHLLVEGLAVAFAGQCEPVAADSPVRDLVVSVRVARDLLLIGGGGLRRSSLGSAPTSKRAWPSRETKTCPSPASDVRSGCRTSAG